MGTEAALTDKLIATSLVFDGEAMSVGSVTTAPDGEIDVAVDLPSALYENPWTAVQTVDALDAELRAASFLTIADLSTGAITDYAIAPGTERDTYEVYGGILDVAFMPAAEQRPCFVRGTFIATPDGPCEVEALVAGDAVVLAAGGEGIVKWVGRRRATDARVVRLRRGALGAGIPTRDLCVSHDHALGVDGVLVPATLLANGVSIVDERWPEAMFFHVELAGGHDILLAEGAPAESYLDTGNRAQFGNCPLGYDPGETRADACATMVVAGPRLRQARDSLPQCPGRPPLLLDKRKHSGTIRKASTATIPNTSL